MTFTWDTVAGTVPSFITAILENDDFPIGTPPNETIFGDTVRFPV
jgi:hypothetical protein